MGIGLAALCFTLAYFVDFLTVASRYGSARLEWFPAGFSLTAGSNRQEGLILALLCVGFNVINVLMEEGLFRGLFLTVALTRYRFATANLLGALLFGLWHVVMPLRSLADGQASLATTVAMAVAYIVLAGIFYRHHRPRERS